MMKRLIWVLWVVALLLLITPTLAQEATAESPAEPPVVVVETPAETGINLATLFYGIVVAVLSGGSLALILTRFGSRKENLDAMEKLYMSFPPQTQETIARITDVAVKLVDILQKVTDKLPNEDVPPVLMNEQPLKPNESGRSPYT